MLLTASSLPAAGVEEAVVQCAAILKGLDRVAQSPCTVRGSLKILAVVVIIAVGSADHKATCAQV